VTLDPIEEKLARYSLAAPPRNFKDELIAAVDRRIVGRRRMGIVSAVFAVLLISGLLTQVLARSAYRQAMQLADGESRPVPMSVMVAYATAMGGEVPDSGTPLRPNGG